MEPNAFLVYSAMEVTIIERQSCEGALGGGARHKRPEVGAYAAFGGVQSSWGSSAILGQSLSAQYFQFFDLIDYSKDAFAQYRCSRW